MEVITHEVNAERAPYFYFKRRQVLFEIFGTVGIVIQSSAGIFFTQQAGAAIEEAVLDVYESTKGQHPEIHPGRMLEPFIHHYAFGAGTEQAVQFFNGGSLLVFGN